MPKTLLLADDSVTIQRVIELTFAHEDVRVVSVSDGRRAIQWLDAEQPDIVLVDVEVPDADGYEVATHVKQSPRLAHVPVLLLAGAFEPVDEARARAIGCDGVLIKPFEPQQLVSRVNALLSHAPAPPLAGVAVPAGEARDPARRLGEADGGVVTAFPSPGGGRMLPPLHAVPSGSDLAGAPEPLEPPVRPVWELGLPSPLGGRPAAETPAAAPNAPAPPKVSLVSAFSALLAAEASAQPTAAAPAPAAPVSEASVEDAVRRVLVRMTDDLVRRIVVETAERLIREEIEKIKSSPE